MLAGPPGNAAFGRATHQGDAVDPGHRGWDDRRAHPSGETISRARSLPGEITIDAFDRRFAPDAVESRLRGWTSPVGAAIVLALAAASACWMSFSDSYDIASPKSLPEQNVGSIRPKDVPVKGDRLVLVGAASSSEVGRSPVLEQRSSPRTPSISRGDNKPPGGPADTGPAAKNAPSPPPQRTAAVDPRPEPAQTRLKLIAIPETKPSTLPGWAIRDVVDNTAILESPSGIVRVARGDTIAGVGKVLTIVRWGNHWIVATSGGLISSRSR